MSGARNFDFNADPKTNYLNTIIWQIKVCEEIFFNTRQRNPIEMIHSLRGLLALLDETAKNKFAKEIKQLYDVENNTNAIGSSVEIEHMFCDVMTYLNSTIFKEMRMVKPRNPNPEHIRE